MPVIKVSAVTWKEVVEGQQRLRAAFGEVLRKERETTGASLRDLGDKYGISHMTVQNLIELAEARRAEQDKVTA